MRGAGNPSVEERTDPVIEQPAAVIRIVVSNPARPIKEMPEGETA